MFSRAGGRGALFVAVGVSSFLLGGGQAAMASFSPPVNQDCAAAQNLLTVSKAKADAARQALRKAKKSGSTKKVKKAKRRLADAREELGEAKALRDTACTNLYVALGDSVTAGTSYVTELAERYGPTLGVTVASNRAQGGATSGSLRTSGQLANALADIGATSDTRVVTIGIGGNDALGGCVANSPSCAFRSNFSATLADLRAALAADPGDEPLIAMAYYNPASGTGSAQEAQYDTGLHGDDGVLDCGGTGSRLGLNDVIAQEAAAQGALLANPHAAFKQAGQAYMADSLHPNAAGDTAIANAFLAAGPPCG